MNRVAAGGVAILVLLSLTGCLSWLVRHDVAEEPLREQIGDLTSVVEVSSFVDSVGAFISVSVSELNESDLVAIVVSADELLAGRNVAIKIRFDQHNLLTMVYPNDFSADELAIEVHYWLAVSNANGAPLGMLLQDGRQGSYRNIWDPDKTDTLNWDALRAVPDPSTADRSWFLDDIVAYNSMPTADIVALRDRLATIELGAEESLSLDFSGPGYVDVRYLSPEAGRPDPTAESSWPRVREIVAEIAALGLPQSNFNFRAGIGPDVDYATLHLGDCVYSDDHPEPHLASVALVDALIRSGIDFPRGVSVGYCNDH